MADMQATDVVSPVYEWDVVVRRWDRYGHRVEGRTPAKILGADRAEVTTKVRVMFDATYDTFRKFWSHDWTLSSVREVACKPPGSTEEVAGFSALAIPHVECITAARGGDRG